MAETNGKKHEISWGDDCDAVVHHGATTVELNTSGDVIVRTQGKVIVYTDGGVHTHPAANSNLAAIAKAAKPGDCMPDGTIYAGISPDTHKPMYATPADAALTMEWTQAMKYAEELDAHGHRDWRVPTKGELNLLFNNRAAIGGFDESGSYPAGWYWSSTAFEDGEE